jgi:hypothetical protein
MSKIFEKLNLKNQKSIVVIDAPASFEPEIASLEGVAIERAMTRVRETLFAIAFATKLAEVEALANEVKRNALDDPIVWVAYPKGTSRTYRCEFNRDNGWASLGEAGFEPVRQVAIDDDWSALRFRRVNQIKTLSRDPSRRLTRDAGTRTED